jgi:hypothetical protein
MQGRGANQHNSSLLLQDWNALAPVDENWPMKDADDLPAVLLSHMRSESRKEII